MSLPFLLEIGTEEIPDWMIEPALESFETVSILFTHVLTLKARVKKDATPRRLVIRAEVEEREPSREESISGPPTSAGPKAAEGFARKMGVSVADLEVETTAKGEYYRFNRKIEGRLAKDVLSDALRDFILKTYFPKTMYWPEKNGPRFIRPIRWIVALLGDEVIDFPPIAGVAPGSVTSGHRILGAAKVPVTTANYEQKLRENFVILSAKEREERIRAGIGKASDDDLLRTLVYLTEYPSVISGTFDKEYLKLPAEVLVTVMKHHQKYFAVYENGQLANRFLAVTNTDGDPDGLIRRGNERVLRARFNDAKFFWETDQKKKLADRILDLEHVTFHAKFGTYRQKSERVTDLVRDHLQGDKNAIRAAQLCKCDLTTELVKEFTELQGVVGGLYARVQGEPDDVWTAIYDHYKPVSMEDSIPRNCAGQLVSIADKLDTLISCFKLGLIPSGSKDPFALRRAAQGIVKILVEGELRLPIRKLLNNDAKLEDFLLERIRYYFKDIHALKFKYDEVNAILAAGWDDLVDVEERLIAIQAIRPTENFEPLATSFKRIRNILKQAQVSDAVWRPGDHPENGPELELYEGVRVVSEHVEGFRARKNYRGALEAIATLRPTVDRFFDEVLVNDPDPEKRRIRLTLLGDALKRFSTIADFSEIITNG